MFIYALSYIMTVSCIYTFIYILIATKITNKEIIKKMSRKRLNHRTYLSMTLTASVNKLYSQQKKNKQSNPLSLPRRVDHNTC